jgi:Na+/proline symporter
VDSTLLVCSSLFSHNLVLPLRPGLDERAKLRLARAGVVGFGVVATVVALLGDSVSALVHEASALGSAGILVASSRPHALRGRAALAALSAALHLRDRRRGRPEHPI